MSKGSRTRNAMSNEWVGWEEATTLNFPDRLLQGEGRQTAELDPSAVDSLADKKLTGVISFNENKYIHDGKERPKKSQHQVSLAPCHQLHRPNDAQTQGSPQIPLQLVVGKGLRPARNIWNVKNHIEKPIQFEVLNGWWEVVKEEKV